MANGICTRYGKALGGRELLTSNGNWLACEVGSGICRDTPRNGKASLKFTLNRVRRGQVGTGSSTCLWQIMVSQLEVRVGLREKPEPSEPPNHDASLYPFVTRCTLHETRVHCNSEEVKRHALLCYCRYHHSRVVPPSLASVGMFRYVLRLDSRPG